MGPGPGLVTQFFSRKILARISEEKIPVRRKTYSSPKFWVVEILYLRVNSNSKVNSQIRKTKIERERRGPFLFEIGRSEARCLGWGSGSLIIYSLVLGCATGGYSRARVVGVYGKGATSEAGS